MSRCCAGVGASLQTTVRVVSMQAILSQQTITSKRRRAYLPTAKAGGFRPNTVISLELIATVWRWQPPEGVLMSLTSTFDRRELLVFLTSPERPNHPAVLVQVLPTATPSSVVYNLDHGAACVLAGNLSAPPPSPVNTLGDQLAAAGAAFDAAVSTVGRCACGGCDSL